MPSMVLPLRRLALVLCLFAASSAFGVSRPLPGGPGSSFSAAANWNPAGTPGPTDALNFPGTITTHTINIDVPGMSVGPMTFGDGYTITGNALTLTGDITASKNVTWASDVTFSAPITLLTSSGATIVFSGAVDVGGQSVTAHKVQFTGTLNGGGTITTGNSQFPLYVGAGGSFNGSFANGGGGSINPFFGHLSKASANMGSLGWAGTDSSIGNLTVNSITSNGVIGVLHTKSFQLGGGTLDVYWSNGNSLSNGQASTIQVTGSVTLNGGQLKVHNLPPLVGQTVTVIDNDGTDAVSGTFAGLPEGGKFYLFGTYGISYHGGDGNDVVITKLTDEYTITKLTQGSAETAYHEPATFTATVTALNGSGTPTGRVSFYIDGTFNPTLYATLQNGVATLTTAALEPGSHAITAFYEGDVGFGASFSQSPDLKHSVLRALSATTISSTVATITYGVPVAFHVNVGPKTPGDGQPAGSVIIIADGEAAGTGTLFNGTATINSTSVHAGTKSIIAAYGGDTRFQPSTSSAIALIVNKVSTIVDPRPQSPLFAGVPSTMKVTISPVVGNGRISSGTVTVKEGTTPLASADLGSNSIDLTLPPLTFGQHSLQVSYSGSADSEASSATVVLNALDAPKIYVHGAEVREGNSGLTPGETAKTIELHVIGDTHVEDAESFSVVLTDPSNAAIDVASAVVVIDNDDGAAR